MNRFLRASVGFSTLLALLLTTSLAFAGVTPPAVDETLNPGENFVVGKTVTTPPIPPNPDICFLADSTGSMGTALNSVKTNATSVMNQVQNAQPTAQFCVAEYRDIFDSLPIGGYMRLNQSMTASVAAAQAAINTWNPGGGGDTPEAQIPSLNYLATNPAVGFRTGSSRIIVWFGDSNGHNPRAGVSLATAIASLQAANIQVVAIPVTAGGNGLDNGGQATAVVNATGGSIQPANPNAVAAAILAGLQNLPVTVTPTVVGCAPLNVSFAPAFRTVTSGNDANFTETITVPNNPSLAGTKIVCSVDFKDNGNVLATQHITVTIPILLDLNPDTDTNELGPGADHTVTATVTDGNGAGAAGKTVNFSVTAGPNAGKNGSSNTNGSGDASFTYGANQGLAGIGTDTIQACVTDQDGVDHCDTVTKEWEDTTPPDLTLPPDAVNEATGPDGATHDYVASASDAVDPNPVVVCVPPSGSLFPLGDTVITCTATDAFGNFSEGTFTKSVVDTTPPVPQCVESDNPGGNEPKAPGEGNQGQNQDGFYQMFAEDIVDLDPEVFVVDMGSDNLFGTGDDFVFGPFPSATTFKYTEANGAEPSQKKGSGEVDWKLKGQGDAAVFAVDFSDNVSEPVFCFVPPPPK
jgi:hypothetical protein